MTQRHIISTPHAPAAVGPYSQAASANGFLFTAGQLGLVPDTKQLAEGGIQAQTRQALLNLKAILEAAGTDLSKVVKTTVFLINMGDFAAMNEVYAEFFTGDFPARSTIAVAQLPLGGIVEIEAVALLS